MCVLQNQMQCMYTIPFDIIFAVQCSLCTHSVHSHSRRRNDEKRKTRKKTCLIDVCVFLTWWCVSNFIAYRNLNSLTHSFIQSCSFRTAPLTPALSLSLSLSLSLFSTSFSLMSFALLELTDWWLYAISTVRAHTHTRIDPTCRHADMHTISQLATENIENGRMSMKWHCTRASIRICECVWMSRVCVTKVKYYTLSRTQHDFIHDHDKHIRRYGGGIAHPSQ